MPRGDTQAIFVPTLLDRLIDDEPGDTREAERQRYFDLRELEIAVRRDLEKLLNTRQEILQELPAEFAALRHSLVTYGLPDFTSQSLASANDRGRVRRALELAVEAFEPRLTRVRVLLEDSRDTDRALRFRIEALLRVDPAPEPVTFDAILQLATQEVQVEGGA